MFNTKKLKNNKYFVGQFKKFKDTEGWFVGSFFDKKNPLKTDRVEVMHKEHQAGDLVKSHYHKRKSSFLSF